jgi:predicted AAA+ superfamily ATPase
MISFDELYDDNPWWKDGIEFNDKELRLWNESIIKWDPRIRKKFDFNNDIVYSLRGPRQVGKTTLAKLQIKYLLQRDISRWNIFYYPFDLSRTPQDLVDILKVFLENTRIQRARNRTYLFLDEIAKIKDWQTGIKRLWDQNKLYNCTIIVTSSHSIDLRKASERLPGRRGNTDDVYDKIMLPMKFSEYISCIDHNLKGLMNDNFDTTTSRLEVFREIITRKINTKIDLLLSYLSDLNQHLKDYMLTGGIPKVVDEYVKMKRISPNTYNLYVETIKGDINDLNKNEIFFRQLIHNIIDNMGWATSWKSLQKDTDIGSHNTVSDYITTLNEMFVMIILYQYHLEKKIAIYSRDKKIYFRDPFFLHAIHGWISKKNSFELSLSLVRDESKQGILVEGIVADHLIRLAFALSEKKQSFDYIDSLFYWRYGKNEIDFVLNNGTDVEIPIEVKFQNTIDNRDLDDIINFKRESKIRNQYPLLLTKDKFDIKQDCLLLPASVFLSLI